MQGTTHPKTSQETLARVHVHTHIKAGHGMGALCHLTSQLAALSAPTKNSAARPTNVFGQLDFCRDSDHTLYTIVRDIRRNPDCALKAFTL